MAAAYAAHCHERVQLALQLAQNDEAQVQLYWNNNTTVVGGRGNDEKILSDEFSQNNNPQKLGTVEASIAVDATVNEAGLSEWDANLLQDKPHEPNFLTTVESSAISKPQVNITATAEFHESIEEEEGHQAITRAQEESETASDSKHHLRVVEQATKETEPIIVLGKRSDEQPKNNTVEQVGLVEKYQQLAGAQLHETVPEYAKVTSLPSSMEGKESRMESVPSHSAAVLPHDTIQVEPRATMQGDASVSPCTPTSSLEPSKGVPGNSSSIVTVSEPAKVEVEHLVLVSPMDDEQIKLTIMSRAVSEPAAIHSTGSTGESRNEPAPKKVHNPKKKSKTKPREAKAKESLRAQALISPIQSPQESKSNRRCASITASIKKRKCVHTTR
jgi:hypothetical protein